MAAVDQSATNTTFKKVVDGSRMFFAGGLAGAIARTATAPLDRIKLLFQVQAVASSGTSATAYTGVGQAASKIIREEGVKAFWKGNGTNIIRIFPYSAAQLAANDQYKRLVADPATGELTVPRRLVAGACAGMTATALTHPLDTVRLRLALPNSGYNGMGHAIVTMVRTEGVVSLYKGLVPTLIGVAPYAALNFASYDMLKRWAYNGGRIQQSTVSNLLMGAAAGTVAATVCYPLDTVRRRMQMKGSTYKNQLDALRTIWTTEGYRGYYRGWAANTLKVVPQNAIRFVSYETLKSLLDRTFVRVYLCVLFTVWVREWEGVRVCKTATLSSSEIKQPAARQIGSIIQGARNDQTRFPIVCLRRPELARTQPYAANSSGVWVSRKRDIIMASAKGDPTPVEDASSVLHEAIPIGERDGFEYLKIRDIRDRLEERPSPFCHNNNCGGGFVGDKDLLQMNIMQYETDESSGAQCQGLMDTESQQCLTLPSYALRSGPRATIYHNPSEVTAALVTCGGLCPGLNDVVLNIVTTLIDYGVPEDQIFGIKYGLRGFLDRHAKPIQLGKKQVDGIQLKGGTVLGTSRGNAKIKDIVDRLRLWGVNHLYVIGGNGGNAAAHAIAQECLSQGVVCNVVGVPKSIDNDIQIIDKCFGFDTAVEEAQRSLICARVEAKSAAGISIVKLMGRQSGFIAMNASMASGVVDVCLIPEIKFTLPNLLKHIGTILEKKDYCVLCVAEGAGQDVLDGAEGATDASGNPILKDIGTYLRDEFKKEFKGVDIKYIDPSYMIRSIPTITTDRIYCKVLGQAAVHGAFAGFTDFTVGLVNTHYVMLPTTTIIQSARTVDPKGRQWNRLKTAISQPDLD